MAQALSTVLLLQRMNKLQISLEVHEAKDEATWALTYTDANRLLSLLRSDHFREIVLLDAGKVAAKDLKFLIQLTRLLKSDGQVVLDSSENGQLNTLLKTLNLHEGGHTQQGKHFLRSPPQQTQPQQEEKLAIGFHAVEQEEQIDEDQLLQGEGINLKKQQEACDTKPRACANCSCGRKDVEVKVSKEELVKSVNEGNPVSGCGKCFLGDSFRCGTCPYKGLPAFKPGDRLKLEEDGGVQVEQAATFVSAGGKIKLQL